MTIIQFIGGAVIIIGVLSIIIGWLIYLIEWIVCRKKKSCNKKKCIFRMYCINEAVRKVEEFKLRRLLVEEHFKNNEKEEK